ncbi:hypothetical protein EU545_03560 [Candidatus Thorarchaeota archaeon]|nr:MAG: hypothetical protein EU545_03560 [Candidatus Thorarchaeota archaeon]
MSDQQEIAGAKTERGFVGDLPKYFVHGIIYSIIAAAAASILGALSAAFASVLAVVTGIGGDIAAWIVAIVLLVVLLVVTLLIIGIINSYLSATFWRISSPMNWKSLIGHGAAFAFAMLIFGLPAFIVDFVFQENPTLLVVLLIPRILIYSVIYGYTGRFVALGFGDVPVATSVSKAPAGLLAACPSCGIETLCRMYEEENMKVISCTNCGLPFEVSRPE